MTQFDCKVVIYSNRSLYLQEGKNKNDDDSKPIVKALRFFPSDQDNYKPYVEAEYSDGTRSYIYDIDEVYGNDVEIE